MSVRRLAIAPAKRRMRPLAFGALALLAPVLAQKRSLACAAELVESAPPPEVVVTAPLQGSDLSLDEVPGNVQRVTAAQLNQAKARDASDALNQLAGSVNINDTQGNPFQPDVNFRGFTASPVLGTPQGVSVFLDGVRVNEAFGDSVNWDLIPSSAIASLEVIPGSDPVFGLNTLGGAVAVNTKRGFDSAGTAVESYGGSFGRRVAEFETGGHGERLDYFLTGNLFDEDGWGQHNPTRVRQGFGKVGYRDDRSDMTLSFTYADNRLEGNQTLPRSFLSDPWQSYSWPDTQTDRMAFVDLNASHRLTEGWTVAAKAYYRKVSTGVLNSNVNDNYDPAMPIGAGNEPTGNVIEGIDQYRPGAALQLTGRSPVAGHRNTLIAGMSYDGGTTNFQQLNQEAGSSRDTSSSAPVVLGTLLHATNRYSGVYVTDTLGLTDRLYINFAGRYNNAIVRLQDRLGTALNGDHSFNRFNPAVGLTFNPTRALTLYASYEEGTRVPTPVELTCADPNAPCSLPNAFSADPALKAVVARTAEIGARGTLTSFLTFNGAIFRTNLDNDIQFVSSGGGAASSGFFENVGQTRRQGVELGLDGTSGAFTMSAHYTYLEATFQTPLVLSSQNNSTASASSCPTCTAIRVAPGDRIPGIPRQIVKLRGEYAPARYAVGVNLTGQSNQFARGDENNQDMNGPLPGFILVNVDAHFNISPSWHVFARVDNLFDRRYFTFATLGENVFTAPGNVFDPTGRTWRSEQFRTVGAPRGAWVGVEFRAGGSDTSSRP
jgi:outer membrane receptor protein involved in Fe transport